MIALLVGLAAGAELEGAAELRAITTIPSAFALDPDGVTADWGPVLDTRLRLGGGVHHEDLLRADAELDVGSGQLAGTTWALADVDERDRHARDAVSLDGIVPRRALVGARLPWFDAELGLTTSQWGLGMVANDGATDPLFGRSDFGDRAIRARLATAPLQRAGERFPLFVIAALDRVVADDLARMWEGDVAWQGVAALLYADDLKRTDGTAAPRRAGLYGVRRHQQTDGRDTDVWVVDGYGDVEVSAGSGADVRVASEAALITGRTDAARSYNAPDGLAVRQVGWVVQSSVARSDRRAAVHLNGAFASGDGSSDDDRVTDFRFDRDYAVGTALFEEVQGGLDLVAWAQASDSSVAAHPPDGVDTLAAEGAFHQAVAAQPAVQVAPLPWLDLAVGGVWAWSTGPIAQPFQSFRAGGVPTNGLGTATEGRFLGTELDWRVATRPAAVQDWALRPELALVGAHAFPSADLAGDAGRVDHLLLLGRLRL